ncbi:uncharacterized protein LOC115454723 isoform X2 [Manduca sexta]|uniref:uncharacterized protein LOC115454723 isoform X2 n=1 Tax=Manduca sexta TaxID=7130 RepID=UPI00188F9045|nr:uncharacterized protein LOC115454723 isoform X2 [Manduca sexta]
MFMNKRCSARMRIREEWSRLKETDNLVTTPDKFSNKHQGHPNTNERQNENYIPYIKNIIPVRSTRKLINNKPQTSDVLRGVVALVDVGSESRALALRAALTALGSSVVPKWSPLVTHLIWSQGGDRAIRAKARALACRLVSPLWVEACAASAKRLPEQSFPAAPRPSDLPSPRTLKQMLKKADMENLPLSGLLTNSKDEMEMKELRLRISSETDRNTSSDANTTRDTSRDKSRDTTDVESRVNTAPRRAMPMSLSTSPLPPKNSRRKLFTHKDPDITRTTDDDSEAENTNKKRTQRPRVRLTQKDRRDLARAERMARRMLAATHPAPPAPPAPPAHADTAPRIVLTGMNRTERQSVSTAIKSLGGRIQTSVNKRTTHVLLGSCRENNNQDITGVTVQSGVDTSFRATDREVQKARTLNALLGAARGCRLLHLHWALHSAAQGRWLHHVGYEVEHLKKISQKARIERTALGQQRANYSYDVFGGTKVLITNDAQQKDAAIQLLTICGAIVIDGARYQHGGQTQNGGPNPNGAKSQTGAKTQNKDGGENQDGRNKSGDFDVKIGVAPGEVSSKWVFDSVASARMRTIRRYVI